MKQKILITGGTGLLGRNWAELIKNDFDTHISIHKRVIKLKNISNHNLPFGNFKKLRSFLTKLKPKYIIHTLGVTSVEKCEMFKKETFEINVGITKNLSKVCKELKIKLIYISTDHLFDGKKDIYDEHSKVIPINYYAKTKYEAEKYVLSSSRNLVLRCNFFGIGFAYRKSFSDHIIDKLKSGKKIQLFLDVYFSPLSISNLVKASQKLINLDHSGIFNMSSNEGLSKYHFGKKIAEKFNLDQDLIEPILFEEKKKIDK